MKNMAKLTNFEKESKLQECLTYLNLTMTKHRKEAFNYYDAWLFREEIALVIAAAPAKESLYETYVILLGEYEHLKPKSDIVRNLITMCKAQIENKFLDDAFSEPILKIKYFLEDEHLNNRFLLELDCFLNGEGYKYYMDHRTEFIVANEIIRSALETGRAIHSEEFKDSASRLSENDKINYFREAISISMNELTAQKLFDGHTISIQREYNNDKIRATVLYRIGSFQTTVTERVTATAIGI